MNNLLNFFFNSQIINTYNRNLNLNGFTPLGLFWNSKKSQYNRFDTLLFLIMKFKFKNQLRISDIGCGYGSLLAYLREKKINFYYSGYDINKNLIKHCIKNYPETFFKVSYFPTEFTDITIASGTYNYTATNNVKIWEEYIIFNLKKCMAKSKLGLIFNLQFTKKEGFIKNNIYYTNIDFMLNKLKKEFSKVTKFYSTKSLNDIYFIILK